MSHIALLHAFCCALWCGVVWCVFKVSEVLLADVAGNENLWGREELRNVAVFSTQFNIANANLTYLGEDLFDYQVCVCMCVCVCVCVCVCGVCGGGRAER